MIEKKSIEIREAFATALMAGTPKEEVMRTLGIAQSTYYAWSARLHTHGDAWVTGKAVTRAKRIAGLTVEAFHQAVAELSLLHPTLGPKALATLLSTHYHYPAMSPSMVHNILCQEELGSRNLRAAKLHDRFIADKTIALSPSQERLVATIDPLVRWKERVGRYPGEVLTQDTIHLHERSPFGATQLSIVVDTYDESAFASFTSGGATCEFYINATREAIDYFNARAGSTEYLYTDRGHEYGKRKVGHPYLLLLQQHRIVHRLIAKQDLRRNPYVQKVWSALRAFLINGGVANLDHYRGRMHLLNPAIQAFLREQSLHV